MEKLVFAGEGDEGEQDGESGKEVNKKVYSAIMDLIHGKIIPTNLGPLRQKCIE